MSILSWIYITYIIAPIELPVNPCNPSPCGPNSQCREINGQAVCSCLPNYIGSPPSCRPECTVSSECSLDKACVNQKCVDPCPGVCGLNAKCVVKNHSPICSCDLTYTGDPFTRCYILPRKNYPCIFLKRVKKNKIFSSTSPYSRHTSQRSMCSIAMWTKFWVP